jgi:hypothetical protein
MQADIDKLIEEAHDIFPDTSIYEVMDVDRDAAILRLSVYYGLPDMEKVERYLAILGEVRNWEDRGMSPNIRIGSSQKWSMKISSHRHCPVRR